MKISAGQALSAPLQIPANTGITRIGIPADWSSAPLTFLMSLDGNVFLDMFHAAQSSEGPWATYEETVMSPTPGSILLLPSDAGFDVGWLKLRSGTKQTPVVQEGDREFAIVFS